MVTEFWKKQREKIFPEITDWRDSQDKIRNERDLDKLKWKEWFFIHPSAYTLIIFGGSIISMLMFLSGSIIFFFRDNNVLSVVFGIMSLLFIYEIIVKFNKRHLEKGVTFYDLNMREYDAVEEEKQETLEVEDENI